MNHLPRLALVAALLIAAAPAAPAIAATPAPATQQATAKHKAVFDMTSGQPAVWDATLRNLENLTAHYGPANVSFEVVGHGAGIGLMLKSNAAQAARMEALAKQGVIFAACNNTMKRKQIARSELLPFVTVVPAGVAELIEKQEAGWAYIKAGH
ncbi:MAG: DsrE family protein [Candidatus Sericytochromatia bacterium]